MENRRYILSFKTVTGVVWSIVHIESYKCKIKDLLKALQENKHGIVIIEAQKFINEEWKTKTILTNINMKEKLKLYYYRFMLELSLVNWAYYIMFIVKLITVIVILLLAVLPYIIGWLVMFKFLFKIF